MHFSIRVLKKSKLVKPYVDKSFNKENSDILGIDFYSLWIKVE